MGKQGTSKMDNINHNYPLSINQSCRLIAVHCWTLLSGLGVGYRWGGIRGCGTNVARFKIYFFAR